MNLKALSLKQVPFFKELRPEEFQALKGLLKERAFRKGQILFSAGSSCDTIYIVKQGVVKVFRVSLSGREQILELLEPGNVCACHAGEFPNWRCASSAEALTACRVWWFSRADYARFLQDHPVMHQALNQLLAQRIRCFSSLIEEVSLKDVRKRLVKFLLELADRDPQPSGRREIAIDLAMTREDIARRLGTTRETVARYLSQLKREKLIDPKPLRIVLKDRKALEGILQG